MAFEHGIAANLSIGGVQYEGYIEDIDFTIRRELAEIKTLGNTSVVRVAGLLDFSFAINGDYDPTLDAAIYNAAIGAAPVTVGFEVGGATYTVSCWVPEYHIRPSSTDANKVSFNLASTGNCTRV